MRQYHRLAWLPLVAFRVLANMQMGCPNGGLVPTSAIKAVKLVKNDSAKCAQLKNRLRYCRGTCISHENSLGKPLNSPDTMPDRSLKQIQ